MVRRRSDDRGLLAERHFPVRVRVAVPPRGFDRQLDEMRAWLDGQLGPANWWNGRGAIGVQTDSVCFYFLSAEDARAFVGRFACGLVIEGEWEGPVDR
jgi:hypothetical protein